MSARFVLAPLLLAVLGLAGCAESGEPDPASTPPPAASAEPTASAVAVENAAARRFVEAVNSGSTDEIMATLADGAIVIDSGRRFADAGAIRDWLEAEVTGVDGRITVRSEQPGADGTELRVDFDSSGFSGTDLRYRFTTNGDRITNLTLG